MASISVAGDSSGSITIAAPAVAGSGVLTLPVATDTLAGIAATQTLTNKTLVAPALGTPASGVLTNCTGVVAAALPAGSVLQVVNSQSGAVATTTTIIPFDDTIPQITEGGQFLSLAITPKSATSKLLIHFMLNLAHSASGPRLTAALFQDSIANAIAAGTIRTTDINTVVQPTSTYFMTSGTTSSTTFTVRGGCDGAGTTTLNGTVGARVYGGVLYSSITITEIAA